MPNISSVNQLSHDYMLIIVQFIRNRPQFSSYSSHILVEIKETEQGLTAKFGTNLLFKRSQDFAPYSSPKFVDVKSKAYFSLLPSKAGEFKLQKFSFKAGKIDLISHYYEVDFKN